MSRAIAILRLLSGSVRDHPISLAMILGYFAFGALAERLARRGVQPMTVAAYGMFAFMVVQLLLIVQWAALALPLWLLFGFCGTSCILPYAVLSQSFPKNLAGRANTGLNVLVFVAAFAAQWVIGWIIGLWPQDIDGGYHAFGYRAGFALILGLQVFAAIWYGVAGKRLSRCNSSATAP